MRIRLVFLGIIGRPAAAGRRVTAIAADVNAERQPQFFGQGVDRPITVAAERLVGARRHVDLHIFSDFGAAPDLGDRRLGVVLPNQNGRLQPGLAAGPMRELPFVDGALDRGAGGLEDRMPLLWTAGVNTGRLTKEEFVGAPVVTVSRGKIAFANGELRAGKGDGRYVERPPFSPVHVANSTWKQATAPQAVRRADVTP